MAEAALVNAIERELDKRGAWHINIHGSGMGRNGLPDIVAIHKGRAIVIEAKTRTGRVAPLQAWELSRARRAGAIDIVARHVDDVRRILDAIDAGKHKLPKPSASGPMTPADKIREGLTTPPQLHVLPGGDT